MARIRTVKPEFYTHEGLSDLRPEWHLLAGALLNYADDYGYFKAHPALVLAGTLPLRPTLDVPAALEALAAIDYVRLGTGPDGRRYGQVMNFAKHQRVEHPSKKSIIDGIDVTWDDSSRSPHEPSRNPHEVLTPEQGTGNRERERARAKRARSRSTNEHEQADPDVRVEDERPDHHHHLGHPNLGADPNAEECAPPTAPAAHPRRSRHFFTGPVFDIPRTWADQAVDGAAGGLTHDDVRRFADDLTAACCREGRGVDDPRGNRLAWLDREFARWRARRDDDRQAAALAACGRAHMARIDAAAAAATAEGQDGVNAFRAGLRQARIAGGRS